MLSHVLCQKICNLDGIPCLFLVIILVSFFISNLAYGYFVVVVTFTAMSANENQCAIVF